MRNIEKRQLVRMAEIASEFRTNHLTSKHLKNKGALLNENNIDFLEQEMNFYIQDKSSTLSKEGLEIFNEEYKFLEPLSKIAAQELASSLFSGLDQGDKVSVENYNKEGLKETVNQKSDIKITLHSPNGDQTKKMISLKKYKNFSNPQVASGTWFSTICGLLFEPCGRGTYITHDGETFQSKTSNFKDVVRIVCEHYGKECEIPLNNILQITKEVHQLRYIEQVPEDWSTLIKALSHKAIPDILALFQIAVGTAHDEIKQRFLRRAGLVVAEEKEIMYVAFRGEEGRTMILNSMNNDGLDKLLKKLNSPECQLEVRQSGKSFSGQGAQFIFKIGEEILFSANMPLTVNKNGAWANRDRICSKSGEFVKKGQRRAKKAMELDTSTNVYVPTKKFAQEVFLRE